MKKHKQKIKDKIAEARRPKLKNFKTDKIHVPPSDSVSEKGWEFYADWQKYADEWI